MTDKQLLIVLIVFVIVRYSLDVVVFNALSAFAQRVRNFFTREDETYEEIADQREWQDTYDARIERMRTELDAFKKSPTNAETIPGTYNLPHDSIKLDVDLEPAIEEESESGVQEIAR